MPIRLDATVVTLFHTACRLFRNSAKSFRSFWMLATSVSNVACLAWVTFIQMSILLRILNHTAHINAQTNDFKYNNEPFAPCLDLVGSSLSITLQWKFLYQVNVYSSRKLLSRWKDFLGIFGKVWKCAKMNHFIIFCKSCLVKFLTLIMALRLYAAPPQI